MTPDASGPTTFANNTGTGVLNGVNGFGFGGGKGRAARGRGGPYQHIDDLIQVTPGGDVTQPINHLLSLAEQGLRFAQFQVDIGKIDIALQAYIKAYMLAIQVIPQHQDYLSLQTDRKNLGDRYNYLKKTLSESTSAYEEIKRTIKEDNAKTGVQPTSSRGDAAGQNGRTRTPKSPVDTGGRHQRNTSTGVAPSASLSASPGKAKPTVQPKPTNLAGNAIKPKTPAPPGQVEDLRQRFANLRSPPTTPVQDPRIRTRPLPVPMPDKPAGPREMPPTVPGPAPGKPAGPRDMPTAPQKAAISFDGIAPLPKLPAAIYSPARQGSISSETAELPSSTPRGMYSRSSSSAGFYSSGTNHANNSSTNLAKSPSREDYFTQIGSRSSTPVPSRKRRVPLPEGGIITVEELLKYQRIGTKDFRILLIDVRPRADFEDGHILSSATICVDPDVLARDRIEATDVEDSMEVGPAEEKAHFERRHEFDMVVFYDQNSEHLDLTGHSPPAKLLALLTDFDYPEGDPGSKHPKLLKGGLEAWQDSMGGSALQKSSHKRRKSAYDSLLKLRSPTKPIQNAEEARRWEKHLVPPKSEDEDDGEADDDWQPVRTFNEFITRYPPVQESMSSPIMSSPALDNSLAGRLSPRPLSKPAYMDPLLSSEPARPPPAVPRRSYTGLREPYDDHSALTKIPKRSSAATRRRATGLINPGAWCYANSTLQALFASGGFGEELISGDWAQLYRSPKKSDEKIMPPQLLTKILASVFHWMGNGKMDTTKANVLMDYLRHISSTDSKGNKKLDESEILGGRRQMDATEFFVYLFTEIHDETNKLRDRRQNVDQPTMSKGKSYLEGALEYWASHSRANDSIIDKYWRALDVVVTTCGHCGHEVARYDPRDILILNLPKRPSSQPVSIEDLLRDFFSNELLDSYKCDGCGSVGKCRKGTRLARLPDLLCVCFARFEADGLSRSKIATPVEFPFRDLDLSPYTIQGQQRYSSLLTNGNGTTNNMRSPANTTVTTDDHHFTKPFKYDAYAVVQHGGQLTGGHYIGIIRDEPDRPDGKSLWHVADDSRIHEVTVGPGRNDKGSQFLYRQNQYWAGGMEAYMVFYQRKDFGLV